MLDNELTSDDLDDVYAGEYPFEGFEDSISPLVQFALLVVSILLVVGVYRLGTW